MTSGGRVTRTRTVLQAILVVAVVVVPVAACAAPVTGTPAAQSSPSAPRGGEEDLGGGSGGSEQELRSQAEKYVTAVNRGDRATATAITCSGTDAGTLFDVGSSAEDDTWRAGEVTVRGSTGFVAITLDGATEQGVPTPFRYERGRWCIDV